MFGSNNAWGNQQNQQQPQQGGGLFGQTANAFGQPQQQPPAFGASQPPAFGAQPQQQSGGLFGSTQPAPTGGFGGFGATANTGNAFGQPQQRPGFGSTGTNLFGSTNTGTSTTGFGGFGQPQAQQGQQQPTGHVGIGGLINPTPPQGGIFGSTTGTTGFGSTSSPFGAKPAFGATTGTTGGLFGQKPATPFGQTASQAQKPPENIVQQMQPGGPWVPYKEKDTAAPNSTVSVYHTITAHPQYREMSLEEIRLKDYMEGRKTAPTGTEMSIFGQANQPQGLFGQPAQQSTPFGAPAAQSSGSLFGGAQSTNTFGQPTAFGQPAASTNTGFGAPAAANPFGQQQQQPSGGLFGQQPSTTPANPFGSSTTTNTFGQPAASTSTGFGFGSTANQAPKPAGFGFGSTPAQPAAGGGLFGSTTNTGAPATTGFGFGQQQQQPQAQPATTGFGFGAPQTNTAGTTGGLFGTQSTATQQPTGGLFGQTNTAGPKPSLFGQPAAGTSTGTGGGLFGSGGFGTTSTAQQPAAPANPFGQTSTTGTSLFGQPQQQQQQQPQAQPSGSLFGSTGGFGATQNKPATGGGLFGSSSATQAPATTGFSLGGGFGTSTQQTGGGLFGSTNTQQQNTQQQQNQTGQAGTGLFGAPKPAGGLFGAPQSTNTFGATGSTGGFGQSQTQNTGGGLFQQPQQQGQQQPQQQGQQQQQVQAPPPLSSVKSDPYGSSGFFSIPSSLPQANGQTASELFAFGGPPPPKTLPPLSSSLRGTPNLGRSGAKLRGFANPQVSSSPRLAITNTSGLGLSVSNTGGNLFDAPSSTVLDPNAFTPRQSVKKLVLEKKVTGSDLRASLKLGKTNDRSHLLPDGDAESTLGGSVAGLDDNYRGSPAPRKSTAPPPAPLSSKRIGGKLSQIKRTIDLATLADDEYYTIPHMSDLANASHEELKEVEEFVVGRKGWGELRYLEPVNLNEVPNLRDIMGHLVLFETPQECEVYPEGSDRREPGSGLNHKAQITLEKCWPKDPSTGKFIKDPEHRKVKSMERKVRNLPDTTFKSYDPVEGRVVFTVDHFTKYGLGDSSDDDSDNESSLPAMDDAKSAGSGASFRVSRRREDDMPPSHSLYFGGGPAIPDDDDMDNGDNDLDEESERDDEMSDSADDMKFRNADNGMFDEDEEDDSSTVSGGRRSGSGVGNGPIPRAVLPFNQDAVELMRQSLFSQYDTTPLVKKRGLASAGLASARQLVSHFPEAGRAHSGLLDDVPSKRASFGVSREPTTARPPLKLTRILNKDSVVKDSEAAYEDAGLSLGKACRAGWGVGGKLTFTGKLASPHEDILEPSCTSVTITVPPLQTSFDFVRAQQLLDVQFTCSNVNLLDGVPSFVPKSTTRFSDFFPVLRESNQISRLWELGHALFDDLAVSIPEDVSASQHQLLEEALRKASVSAWLEKNVTSQVEKELLSDSQGPERVFTLLSGHQVERAAQASADAGDVRLAVLVAQADGSESFREEMRTQLETWKSGNNESHISKPYRRVYAVLAGIVDVLQGVRDRDPVNASADVAVAEGLDWLRALGLHFWYGTPLEASIAEALNAFRSHLEGIHPPAQPTLSSASKTSSAQDAIYKMLTLYCDEDQSLDTLLRADGYNASPLDVSVQWHLYNILARSLGVRDVEDRLNGAGSVTADKLTIDYAAQLEAAGLWTQAVFVLLHLELPQSRVKGVKDLVGRHGFELNKSTEDVLTRKYQLPQQWLDEVKANCARDNGNIYEEYQHLLRAGLFDRAHGVVLTDLAPGAIIRRDNDLLRRLVEPLADKEVETWNHGGKVLLLYARVSEQLAALFKDNADALDDLAGDIRVVKQGIPSLFPRSQDGKPQLEHAVCIETMFANMDRAEVLLKQSGGTPQYVPVSQELSEAERSRVVENRARARFMSRLQACC